MLEPVIARIGAATAVAAMLAGGCTRLNPAYADGAKASDSSDAGTTAASSTRGEEVGGPSTSAGTTLAPETSAGPMTTTGPPPLDVPLACGTPTEDCEFFDPDACRSSERCVPWGPVGDPEGIGCMPEPKAQPLALGDACQRSCADDPTVLRGDDACPPGAICDPYGDSPTCVALCEDDSAPCDGDRVCVTHATRQSGDFGLCRDCNPTLENGFNGCIQGLTCVVGTSGFDCQPAGETVEGGSCTLINECVPGLICLNDPFPGCDGSCCTAYCIPDIVSCSNGLECLPLPGAVGVGYCGEP